MGITVKLAADHNLRTRWLPLTWHRLVKVCHSRQEVLVLRSSCSQNQHFVPVCFWDPTWTYLAAAAYIHLYLLETGCQYVALAGIQFVILLPKSPISKLVHEFFFFILHSEVWRDRLFVWRIHTSHHIHVEVRDSSLLPNLGTKFRLPGLTSRVTTSHLTAPSLFFFFYFFFSFLFFLKTGSHYCSHSQPETSYIDHVGLELVAILPPECWHYMHPVHSWLNKFFFFF